MGSHDITDGKRAELESALRRAAVDLVAFTQATGAMTPIPGTNPKVFAIVGDAETIVTYAALL